MHTYNQFVCYTFLYVQKIKKPHRLNYNNILKPQLNA